MHGDVQSRAWGGPGAKTGLPRTPPGDPKWYPNPYFWPRWQPVIFEDMRFSMFFAWGYPPDPKNTKKNKLSEDFLRTFFQCDSDARRHQSWQRHCHKRATTLKFSAATVASLHTANTTACENGPAPGSPQNHPASRILTCDNDAIRHCHHNYLRK